MEKLTPKINYGYYKGECKKLDDAINNKYEKNIAISGIFGSGKSSLIKTYEKAFNNKKGHQLVNSFELNSSDGKEICSEKELNKKLEDLDNRYIKKSLFVSLANFNITNDKQLSIEKNKNQVESYSSIKEDGNNKKDLTHKETIVKEISEMDSYKEKRKIAINMDDADIEKSLLQQLIFNVASNKLPDSKIKRVKPQQAIKKNSYIFLILALIFSTIFMVNKFSLLWNYNKFIDKSSLTIVIITGLTCVSLLLLIIKIKSLKIDTVEICASDQNCMHNQDILGRFIDEIIYFFQKTKYEIVYFEDLDRLPDLNIFNKLREINFILNNSTSIKDKITFVYCISDSIISDYEERAKFFDTIITLKPLLTTDNTATKIESSLLNKMESEDKEGLFSRFALDMAKYITDSRLWLSIQNDFDEKVNEFSKLDKVLTNIELVKIMALCIYKNIYYYDYNKLNTREACLSKAFMLIQYLKKDCIDNIQKDIEIKQDELQRASCDECADISILKERILGIIYKNRNNNKIITHHYEWLNLNERITLEDFKEGNFFGIKDLETISYFDIDEYFKENFKISFEDYLKKIKLKIEDNKNQHLLYIQKLQKEISDINSQSISRFLYNHDCGSIKNEFIKTCFKQGYIENDYLKFVFGEKNSYLPEQDDAFIRFNNYGERLSPIEKNYQYKLTEANLSKVVAQINLGKFGSKNILNNQLIEFVLDDKLSPQKKKLKDFLCGEDEDVYNFIVEYIKTSTSDKIITFINNLGNPYWLVSAYKEVLNIIDIKKQNEILQHLISNFNLNNLAYENKEKLLLMINSYINWESIKIEDKEIRNLQNLGKVKLSHLNKFDDISLNYITQSRYFEINYENVEVIANKILTCNDLNKLLGCIINNDFIIFKDYIMKNIGIFLDRLQVVQELEQKEIKFLLLSDLIDLQDKMKIIKECEYKIECLDEIKEEYVKEIINVDKLSYKVETIFNLFSKYDSDLIIDYFDKDKFDKMDCSNISTLQEEDNYEEFIDFIKTNFYLADNSLKIMQTLGVDDINLEEIVPSSSNLIVVKLVNSNIIKFNEGNLNNLIYCYDAYVILIDKNKDEYLKLLKESSVLKKEPELITYILCNTKHGEIKEYILNNLEDAIDFDFQVSIGNTKKTYYGEIVNIILNASIENKKVIFNLFKNVGNPAHSMKLNYLEIISKNLKLLTKPEVFYLIQLVDDGFTGCRSVGEIFKIKDDFINYGLKILESAGIITTNRKSNSKNIKIKNFNI